VQHSAGRRLVRPPSRGGGVRAWRVPLPPGTPPTSRRPSLPQMVPAAWLARKRRGRNTRKPLRSLRCRCWRSCASATVTQSRCQLAAGHSRTSACLFARLMLDLPLLASSQHMVPCSHCLKSRPPMPLRPSICRLSRLGAHDAAHGPRRSSHQTVQRTGTEDRPLAALADPLGVPVCPIYLHPPSWLLIAPAATLRTASLLIWLITNRAGEEPS
jgi:hypothetical protein